MPAMVWPSPENAAFRRYSWGIAVIVDEESASRSSVVFSNPTTTRSPVEENANAIYVIVPHSVAAGAELAVEDLEKVAGGATVKGDANCNDSDGAMNTVVDINAEFSLI